MRAIGPLAITLGVIAGAAPVEARPLGATRPRTARVWESIAPSAAPTRVNSHTIYLNRCPTSGCVIAQGNTNSTADPVRSSLGHGVLGPFTQTDEVWNTVVACMKEVYAPFNVEITESDPGVQPHFEIIFGGKPQDIGESPDLGGVSPFSCVPYIPNSVVFVFDVWGNNAEELCATAAQEIAHSFAIDHATEPSDPMTYFEYPGRRHYMNAQVQCGSDCDDRHRSPTGLVCTGPLFQDHACACGNGAQTQNDYQIIATLFGDEAATPPVVKITSPRVGATVEPGFVVSADARDDVAVTSTELRVDGALVVRSATGARELGGPTTLADGTHTVEVTAYDNLGTPGRARIQVVVGPGCQGSADCPLATDACIAGRCVAGPDAEGGLGDSCNAATDCASWLCANDDGARHCVEACQPGQCPSGFGCRDDGQDGGVCWPGYQDRGACAAGGGDAGPLALQLAIAGLVARRRRRARRA